MIPTFAFAAIRRRSARIMYATVAKSHSVAALRRRFIGLIRLRADLLVDRSLQANHTHTSNVAELANEFGKLVRLVVSKPQDMKQFHVNTVYGPIPFAVTPI